jgi:hypothetical protein
METDEDNTLQLRVKVLTLALRSLSGLRTPESYDDAVAQLALVHIVTRAALEFDGKVEGEKA